MIRACVITGYGINADRELATALDAAGARADRVHVQDLIDDPGMLDRYRIIGFPGGFSFGDHLGSGLVFAHLFRHHLKEKLASLIRDGVCVIGICNGFQVLVKMGVLPDMRGDWSPQVSLIHNDSGTFEDSWVKVAFDPDCSCVWTEGLGEMDLPIRHGEGRFYAGSPETLAALKERRLIALRYSGRNPNGSDDAVAGITDPTGRILGLMPHPEAFLYPENHPLWTRVEIDRAYGLDIFRNGVRRAGE